MRREVIIEGIRKYVDYTMGKQNDYGQCGKVLEVLTRDYLNKGGIQTLSDVKARSIHSNDIRIGRSIKVEVKSGSGAVAYAESNGMNGYVKPFTADDRIAENVLPNVDFVIWYPWARLAIASGHPFKFGFVFSRQQFIDCLEQIGKHGLASSLKISKGGGQINIQTISAKLESRLYDYIENIPTVEEFVF